MQKKGKNNMLYRILLFLPLLALLFNPSQLKAEIKDWDEFTQRFHECHTPGADENFLVHAIATVDKDSPSLTINEPEANPPTTRKIKIPYKASDILFLFGSEKNLFMASYGSEKKLGYVDVQNGTVEPPFDIGVYAGDMCILSGTEIIVLSPPTKEITFVDLRSRTIEKTYKIPFEPHQMFWLAQGITVQVSNKDRSKSAVFIVPGREGDEPRALDEMRKRVAKEKAPPLIQSTTLSAQNAQPPKEKSPNVLEDISMAKLDKNSLPKSQWIESRKKMYRDLLSIGPYDALILPFQVQGYAVDRIGRSLMARYLSSSLERDTGLKTPNLTLVARALGDGFRTYDPKEVYDLANQLNVRMLITGYVGHLRDEKMILTIIIQTREEGKPLTPDTKTTVQTWKDISFSDEQPPSQAFLSRMPDITTKLIPEIAKAINTVKVKTPPAIQPENAGALPVPKDIRDAVKNSLTSPITAAYTLQMLGMLSPEHTIEQEHLFERSLVALQDMPADSETSRILKARAYFHLYRRPAALTALGDPTSAEGLALLAQLNGDLPSAKKETVRIDKPLPKLIAEIELSDLTNSYTTQTQQTRNETLARISAIAPQWGAILDHRLNTTDYLHINSNIEVKKEMDREFPIPDYTAETLITALAAANADNIEANVGIDLSVARHYQRTLSAKGPAIAAEQDSRNPVTLDYLDLYNALGELDLMKKIINIGSVKGLKDQAEQQIKAYDMAYADYPPMVYYRVAILGAKWSEGAHDTPYAQGLLRQRDELELRFYYWCQGQVKTYFANKFPYYDGDYPTRTFWTAGDGDREKLENEPLYDRLIAAEHKAGINIRNNASQLKTQFIMLKYETDRFYPLKAIPEQFGSLWTNDNMKDMRTVIHDLVQQNSHRFIGDPKRTEWATKFEAAETGNASSPASNMAIYQEAMRADPNGWEPYLQLARIHSKAGDFDKAFQVLRKFPLFQAGNNGDEIVMSNCATDAALLFWWPGQFEKATPFFQMAAHSQTGSSSEMMSNYILANMAADYRTAGLAALDIVRRYDSSEGYREYLTLLHIIGYHDEAWSIFNTLDIQAKSPAIWASAFVGQRMQGAGPDETMKWLTSGNFSTVTLDNAGRYMLMSRLIDRNPTGPPSAAIGQIAKIFAPSTVQPNIGQQQELLGDGIYYLRKKDYKTAFEKLKAYDNLNKGQQELPYLACAAAKTKNEATMDEIYATTMDKDSFHVHLSKAYLSGLKGDHAEAAKHLELASYRNWGTGDRIFQTWYQLVEACEWLYKETGNAAYKTLAVRWAKVHQKLQPMWAWAYAVEAKYSDSQPDRLRALAITLYLDKDSEHITEISDADKAKAKEWLQKNNPFLLDKKEKEIGL